MKFLCICARGNSRSVALGWILKDVLNQEAIAIGMTATSPETREMLYAWADAIIVVDQEWLPQVPEQWRGKTHLWHVGGDRFFRAYEPELLNLYADYMDRSHLTTARLRFTENRPGVIEIAVEQSVIGTSSEAVATAAPEVAAAVVAGVHPERVLA